MCLRYVMRLRWFCVLAVSAWLTASVASAQTGSDWIIVRMSNGLQPGATWDTVRPAMMAAFYQSNPDEHGVTAQGIDNLRRISMAQLRAQRAMQILSYDLNGDGTVTRDEIVTMLQPRSRQMIHANGVQLEPTREQIRQQLDRLVSEALKPDTDGDGIITPAEIRQQAQQQAEQASASWQMGATQLVPMTLDADGDGTVSLAEYEAAARAQFDAADRDRDGRLSASEIEDVRRRANEANQAIQRARQAELRKRRFEAAVKGCDVAAPPPGVRLVLLGTGEAKALSSVWIGNEDKITYVTTVEVAPGSEPLSLVLSSGSPMIWDIVGATERVAGIIAHASTSAAMAGGANWQQRVASTAYTDGAAELRAGKPLVGVIGVPRDKIRFTPHTGCLVPVTEAAIKDGSAQEIATMLLGRAADEIGGEGSAATFRVPAARHFRDRPVRNAMPLPKETFGEPLWREVQETFAAGIALVDPETVIAELPVKSYVVLPGRAGMAELVDIGALRIVGMSQGYRIDSGAPRPFTSPNRFKIARKIRLPAGATGTFVLARDVPIPDGDIGQACIVSEVDMKPVAGARQGPC